MNIRDTVLTSWSLYSRGRRLNTNKEMSMNICKMIVTPWKILSREVELRVRCVILDAGSGKTLLSKGLCAESDGNVGLLRIPGDREDSTKQRGQQMQATCLQWENT